MNIKTYFTIIIFIGLCICGCENKQSDIFIKNANSHENYFLVHKIKEAWIHGKGKGIKVGILDHGFGDINKVKLYSGEKDFIKDNKSKANYSHGFWMASTLKEVAPEVSVFALTVYTSNEDRMTEAIINAINWAVENRIDILTFSQARISKKNRDKLDPYIKYAYDKNIAIVFLHYPSIYNFLPSSIEPKIDHFDNDPKYNIYNKDYSVILKSNISENGFVNIEDSFISISSKAVVLGGIIALMKQANPTATLYEIDNALQKTAFDYETTDAFIKNTVNASKAIIYLLNKNVLNV